MNKKIILPFVAILVLAVAMVGAASADEVTTVDTVEIRGTVYDQENSILTTTWDATDFAAFWYDIDENLMSENLTIEAGGLDVPNRVIKKDTLVYKTSPQPQKYEICDKYDDANDTKGIVKIEDETEYKIEGWMAEEYVAVNGKADVLSKLLVEFEGDDKKTLATSEEWNLGSGFTLTANQIDLEGDKVWLSLAKDGTELDSEVIDSSSSASHQQRTYVYTEDIGSEDDVPVFHCYIDAVFRGTDTNIVQVTYVFLIDNEVLEIDSDDTFGIMDVTSTSGSITLRNEDDDVDMSSDSKEHIMGDMYFQTADDDAYLRFYPMVEYTIGDGDGEVEPDDTPTDNETETEPAENATPTVTVTPEPTEDASPAVTAATAADNETDAEPAATTKKPIPGFEAIFAIAGLLAVAYLVLRQRD